MIKKIMAPIAFSPYSQGILNYAAEIAGAMQAELVVVNVINERNLEAVNRIAAFGYKVDSDTYAELIQKERREEIVRLTEKLTLADDKVTFTFLVGDPTNELLRFIIESEIDLVVMGLRTRDIRHAFTGSVAERMFRKCPVPIISYRGNDIASRLRQRVITSLMEE